MRFALGLLIVSRLFAQPYPDASALLEGSATALQRYGSYQFTRESSMDASMPLPMTVTVQAVNPGKMRMEIKTAGMVTTLLVSDGENSWFYLPLTKEYSKVPANSDPDLEGMKSGMGFADVNMPEMMAGAKVVRSETLEVNGEQRDCWVIESRKDSAGGGKLTDVVFEAWIDKALGIELKSSFAAKTKGAAGAPAAGIRTVTTTRSMKFNEDLPDSLFVFTPPADAKENDDFFAAAQSAPAAAPATAVNPQPGDPEAFVPLLNPIDRIEPVYPAEARAQNVHGMVEVLLTIDPAGNVVNQEPLSGPAALRGAALDAVKQWKFRPVLRQGRPVYAYTQEIVDFFPDNGRPTNPDDLGIDLSDNIAATDRTQALAAKFPRSPEQVLADSEDQAGGIRGIERFYALPNLAKQAWAAGALDRASAYANEMLQSVGDHKGDWNYGNAVYTGNMVLGLVALKNGNVADAKRYLLESGKTTGSPQLDSFGPDFTLARALLDKGERDAVAEFLTLCKGFWKLGADRIDGMVAQVRTDGRL